MSLNYEEDIKIEPEALDVEWLEQAELMRKYTKHCADMEKTRDEAKEALDVGKAQIEKQIRSNPEGFGLVKATESAIQSAILLQQEYQTLSKAYIEAKYEYGIAIGVVRAMDQRKTALENLVKLMGQSYFAGPTAPRNLYQEQLDRTERRLANSKVRFTRTRRSGTK